MKTFFSLLTAILLFVSAANAQINKGSIWYENYNRLTCTGVSGNSLNFDLAMWGDDGEKFSLVKSSDNNFVMQARDEYSLFKKIKTVEYREVENFKVLLFKDSKGNILYTFEQTNDKMWEAQILKGFHYMLNGTYVDEKGTKYTISGDEFITGGKTLHFTLDPQGYYIMAMSDDKMYWWEPSTTGINIYHVKQGEFREEQGELWHKLKNVSPEGRWTFLSSQIVPANFMWRYPAGMVRIMRNEIYARHGYVFNSADLKEYFSKLPWYKPLNNNALVKLNAIETLNVDILKANETVAREGSDDQEIEDGLE